MSGERRPPDDDYYSAYSRIGKDLLLLREYAVDPQDATALRGQLERALESNNG